MTCDAASFLLPDLGSTASNITLPYSVLDDKALLFMRRTIGKFPLGVTGKIDHTLCRYEDQVRRGDCEWLKKWEAAHVIAQLIGRNYGIFAHFGQANPSNPGTFFKNYDEYTSIMMIQLYIYTRPVPFTHSCFR